MHSRTTPSAQEETTTVKCPMGILASAVELSNLYENEDGKHEGIYSGLAYDLSWKDFLKKNSKNVYKSLGDATCDVLHLCHLLHPDKNVREALDARSVQAMQQCTCDPSS